MLSFLPGPLRGAISVLLYALNTVFWVIPLFITTFFKLVMPIKIWRRLCNSILDSIASLWITFNNLNIALTKKVKWDVRGLEALKPREWYLVVANHQSWVDILVLQKIFNHRIPFLKFFLKKELIYMPFLGQAWWALDFPFMKRFSKSFLKKHPHLKGKDLETTRKACEKFKSIPVSVMNFVEGTRFNRKKHRQQQSPYTNLLKPRAAGIAFVLAAMGEQLHHILDVTIVYPGEANSFWSFVCGKVAEVKVRVKAFPINRELIGNYMDDHDFRDNFQNWLNNLWGEKDKTISTMLGSA